MMSKNLTVGDVIEIFNQFDPTLPILVADNNLFIPLKTVRKGFVSKCRDITKFNEKEIENNYTSRFGDSIKGIGTRCVILL
jgi:hypothetical protein